MTSAIRPFAALLLFAGSALAHAADGGVADIADITGIVTATTTPPAQTVAEAGSLGALSVSHGLRRDGAALLAQVVQQAKTRDSIRADGWTMGVGSARADRSLFDIGLVARSGNGNGSGNGSGDGSSSGIFDWRDLKAGLNRKLDGGWQVALNYTRPYGAAGASERLGLAGARPAYLGAGRRALVLSAARSF